MKRLLMFFSIVVLFFSSANLSNQPRILLSAFPNGGFETDPTSGQNNWVWPVTNWTWDGTLAHGGTHSARVSRSGGNESGSLYSDLLPITPSTNNTLTYWLRTQNATWSPRVVIYQYRSDKVTQTGVPLVAYANISTGAGTWKSVSYRLQTLPDAAYIRLRIYLYTDTTGTFWFDDISIEQALPARFPFLAGFPVEGSGAVWLSSPAVGDINNDGSNELLIGAGSTVNGWSKAGNALPGFPILTGDRQIVAQIALADLDKDHHLEIIAGTRSPTTEGQCRVFAWRDTGALLTGWPQAVAWNTQYSNNDCWITSVVPADIDGDQDLEIIASTTNNGSGNPGIILDTPNLYAWHHTGTLVSGNWPNWQTAAGIYGAIAVGDLNGDDKADIVVGRDFLYLNVYGADGQSLPGWPIQTYVSQNGGNYDTEQRIEYAVNAPTIADLDGDGAKEIIVTGHVKGPGEFPDVKLNSALLVLETDGTRRAGWESAALGNGILSQIDMPWQPPALADLDADGKLEIVVATEDGWIRAYRADKTVLWSFNYTQGAILFAGEPVIGDINGDGGLEILFGTYVPELNSIDRDGPVGIWALGSDGSVLPGFPLSIPTPGVRSAPSLADLNGDGKLEIIAATRRGQIFVWDTSAAYNPTRLPWPTGRHDLSRSAEYTLPTPLDASAKTVNALNARQNDILTYTIRITSAVPIAGSINLTDTLPDGLAFVPGSLSASTGSASETDGVITWSGAYAGPFTAVISYDATVNTAAIQQIVNTAVIETVSTGVIERSVKIPVNYYLTYSPLIIR
jgi:uncharacterized repeat protein (TIGR01451 family)